MGVFVKPHAGDVLAYGFGGAYTFDVTRHRWVHTHACHINYELGRGYVQHPVPPPGPGVPEPGDRIAWSPGDDESYNITRSEWFPTEYVSVRYDGGNWIQA